MSRTSTVTLHMIAAIVGLAAGVATGCGTKCQTTDPLQTTYRITHSTVPELVGGRLVVASACDGVPSPDCPTFDFVFEYVLAESEFSATYSW
jgi:hypothetical protein